MSVIEKKRGKRIQYHACVWYDRERYGSFKISGTVE
jgi:hypothetical protein